MHSYQSARKRKDSHQTLQQYIINDLNVIAKLDCEEHYWTRVDTLKEFLREKGSEGYVLEISQDPGSVLAGHMAQTAIKELREETDNEDYTFLALILPENDDKEIEREIIEFDINGKQIHPTEPDHNEPTPENLKPFYYWIRPPQILEQFILHCIPVTSDGNCSLIALNVAILQHYRR